MGHPGFPLVNQDFEGLEPKLRRARDKILAEASGNTCGGCRYMIQQHGECSKTLSWHEDILRVSNDSIACSHFKPTGPAQLSVVY